MTIFSLIQASNLLDRILRLFVCLAHHSPDVDRVEGPVEEGTRLSTFGRQTRGHRQREGNDRIQDQGRGFAILGVLPRQGKFVEEIFKENKKGQNKKYLE